MSENLFGLTVAADKGLDDLQCQRLLSENRKYQEVMLQYRCALKALESRLEILNEEFSLQHDRNPIESMKSRLKSPSSIMNKMQKRGLPLDFPTMQANIMDVAGVRVICSFEEDVFFLAKCLKGQSDIEIITEKDYISHPKPNGYRSLHLTIRLPVFFAEKDTGRVMHPLKPWLHPLKSKMHPPPNRNCTPLTDFYQNYGSLPEKSSLMAAFFSEIRPADG